MRPAAHTAKVAIVLLCFACLAAKNFAQPNDELAAKSQQAKALMGEGKFAAAVPLYRELVRALPNNPGLVLNLGFALDYSGHKREALSQFQKALQLDPDNAVATLFLGTTYLDLGDPAKALSPLEKAVRLNPSDPDAQEALAETCLALKKFERAAESFQKLSQTDPANPKFWYDLGLSYDALAQQSFDKLTSLATGSAYWLDITAESRFENQQLFAAFYLYRQALEKAPTLRGIHASIAEIYRKTGHPDWAETEAANERRLPPLDCVQHGIECDFEAGRYRDLLAATQGQTTAEAYYWQTRAYNALARDAYIRLTQLPPSGPAEILMAKMQSQRRQHVEAAHHWAEALKFFPDDPSIKQQLAIALFQTADLEHARKLFDDLIKASPESPELNYYLGDILLKSQKPADALPFLTKAVGRAPHLLPAQASLARTYLALGQSEKAIPYLKAALPIDDDGSLHYQLGRAYQASGQVELARQTLKEYQKIHDQQEAEKQSLNRDIQITPPQSELRRPIFPSPLPAWVRTGLPGV